MHDASDQSRVPDGSVAGTDDDTGASALAPSDAAECAAYPAPAHAPHVVPSPYDAPTASGPPPTIAARPGALSAHEVPERFSAALTVAAPDEPQAITQQSPWGVQVTPGLRRPAAPASTSMPHVPAAPLSVTTDIPRRRGARIALIAGVVAITLGGAALAYTQLNSPEVDPVASPEVARPSTPAGTPEVTPSIAPAATIDDPAVPVEVSAVPVDVPAPDTRTTGTPVTNDTDKLPGSTITTKPSQQTKRTTGTHERTTTRTPPTRPTEGKTGGKGSAAECDPLTSRFGC